jgi:hypothetical protein
MTAFFLRKNRFERIKKLFFIPLKDWADSGTEKNLVEVKRAFKNSTFKKGT